MLKTHSPGARKGADFLYHVDPHQLKVQGVEVVGVYLKNTTRAQIDAYHAAGISVFLIHQRGYEGKLANSASYGTAAGLEANEQAAKLGYPKGLPIVFASMGDYDNVGALTKRSVDYFNAAKAACRWPAGAYGDWDLFDAIGPTALSVQAAAKAWSWDWVARRWRGVHPTASILQLPSKAVAVPNMSADPSKLDWGGTRVDPLDLTKTITAWGPGLDVPVPKPVPVAKPVLKRTQSRVPNAQVKLLQRQLAYPWKWYTGPDDGKFGPQTEAAVKRMQRAVKVRESGVYDVPSAQAFQKFLTAMAALAGKK